MTSASVFMRGLLLIVNGAWVEEVLARRFGRVPEGVPDLIAVLESAAGRGFAEESVSTLSVDVRVSRRCDDGAWEARHPLWYAADFDAHLASVMPEADQLITDHLRGLYGKAADIVYLGSDHPAILITLEMLAEDPGDPDRAIKIVRMPDTPAISDPRFQSIGRADLGRLAALVFPQKPARNGSSSGKGGEERQVTELDAGEEIDLIVSASGALFEGDGEEAA